MKSIDSLTVEIVVIDGKLTAVCRDMGVAVESDSLYQLLKQLGNECDDSLFTLHESGGLEVTDFVKALIGSSEFDDEKEGWQEWLEHKRWRQHRDRLENAFFAAYPKADIDNGFRHMRLPSHDWEDEAWDALQQRAELGLIEQGGDHPEWVKYCRLVYGSSYCNWVPEQKEAWYQEKLDWGLPLLPAKEVKRIFKKDGWDAFKLEGENVKA